MDAPHERGRTMAMVDQRTDREKRVGVNVFVLDVLDSRWALRPVRYLKECTVLQRVLLLGHLLRLNRMKRVAVDKMKYVSV